MKTPSSPKKIIYYTQVFYLDAALEFIASTSSFCELHVVIELTPESRKANIFNLDINLSDYPTIILFRDVAKEWDIENLDKWFKNCASVKFVNHSNKRSLSLSSFFKSIKLGFHLRSLKPDHLHFDDFSLRMIGLLFYVLFNKQKTIMNIHDPKPHTGEKNSKKEILKKVFFRIVNKYVCFSVYSTNILRKSLKKQQKVFNLKLLPYQIYKDYGLTSDINIKAITFVGRISKYKGIEMFLDSVKEINKIYPNQKFIIAGLPIGEYNPFENYTNPNLEIITKHLSNQDMVNILSKSELMVCPYLDATQSGVIMTAYAFNVPVLVTPVGGLPEYVKEITNLISTDVSEASLTKSLMDYLNNNLQHEMKYEVEQYNFDSWRLENERVLLNSIYTNS